MSRPTATPPCGGRTAASSPRACGWPSQLGAEIVTLPGHSVVEEMLAFARARNATRIVVGKSRRSRWFELRHGSVVDELVRSGSGLAIEVAPIGRAADAVRRRDWLGNVPLTPGPYLEGVAVDRLGDRLGKLIDAYIALPNISWCSWCRSWSRRRGMAWRRRSGSRRSACSPTTSSSCRRSTSSPSPIPRMSWRCSSSAVIAIVASTLAARTRTQTESAAARGAHHGRALRLQPQDRGRRRSLRSAVDRRQPSRPPAERRGRHADARPRGRRPAGDRAPAFPPDSEFERGRPRRGALVVGADHPTGRGTDTLPGARWLFVPIRTSRAPVAVHRRAAGEGSAASSAPPSAGCSRRSATRPPLPSSASPWPRTSTRRALGAERERLRSSMLTSVSHDLRTPLASIIGAAVQPARAIASAMTRPRARSCWRPR